MDQAASVFSKRGTALSVSFFPTLQATTIAFPQTDPVLTFLIAQSFVAADKHVTAPECYNLRVVECTLAAAVLAKILGCTLQEDSGPLGISLRGLQDAYMTKSDPSLNDGHGTNVNNPSNHDKNTAQFYHDIGFLRPGQLVLIIYVVQLG